MTDATAPAAPTALVDRYRPPEGRFDELVGADGLRPHWAQVAEGLGRLDPYELSHRLREAHRLLVDDGVTYNVTVDGVTSARRWTLDPLPVVLAADEWAGLERGLAQRAELLDLVLADLYGKRQLLSSGLLPPEVVFGHGGFLRECDGIRLPTTHQLTLLGVDLGRDDDGSWVAIGDRAQAPSGAGYALANRTVASRVLPEVYREADVERLAPFFRELRAALQRVAPKTDDVPNVVVLTPGPWSETYFEHGYLASYLGYPLVQGTDLRVRDGRVWVRTVGRLDPVHVILRRVDSRYCDPLELRPDSQLGVPGLVEACRVGAVSVVNPLGSGVIENPALLAHLPRLCRELLDEDLLLPSVDSYWCGDDDDRQAVLDHLDDMVLRPVDRTGGHRSIVGAELGAAQREELRARIEAEPWAWVGQDAIPLASVPTIVGGDLEPRRSVLRAFAVAGERGFSVMPGGLTRVAPRADEAPITNQRGAWSKDTWVLAHEPERLTGFWLQPPDRVVQVQPARTMPQRAAENLFWLSRYAERAEGLVRLLRTTSERLTEFAVGTNPAGSATVQVLLEALTTTTGCYPGFVGDGAVERVAAPLPELGALLVDVDRVGSVAHSVQRMLEAAGEVRDQLSVDTWLVVGHLGGNLASIDDFRSVVAVELTLDTVMQSMLAFAGLGAESMVRDEGWYFMDAGRRIERALQLCRLLEATVTTRRDDATDSLVLESVLASAESIITYRRRYRSMAQLETALDLLLLDADNPRSVAFQVQRLVAAAKNVPAEHPDELAGLQDLLEQLVEALLLADTNALARVGDDGRRDALAAELARLVELLSSIAAEVDRLHFTHQLPQRPVYTPGHPSNGTAGAVVGAPGR